MADRKHTPDVLSEILTGNPEPVGLVELASQLPVKPARKAVVRTKDSERKQTTRQASSPHSLVTNQPQTWEYLCISFQNHKGWHARFVNGVELNDWINAPALHNYLKNLGEQGWEMCAASSGECLYGLNDKLHLYFKRPLRID